jgi:hypothetical protein
LKEVKEAQAKKTLTEKELADFRHRWTERA